MRTQYKLLITLALVVGLTGAVYAGTMTNLTVAGNAVSGYTTTGNEVYVNATQLTTGNAVKILAVDATLNGGKYLNLYNGATSVFSIGEDGYIDSTGQIDTWSTSTAAGGDRGVEVGISQDTGTALTGTLVGVYARATGGDTGAAGTVRGCEIGGRVEDSTGKIASVVTGGYFWADSKSRTATTLRGLEVSLDGGASGTSTLAQGLYIANNSSGTQTTSYAIDINAGTATGHKAFTKDLRLQLGETIDNATDGTVQIVSGVVKHAYDSLAYWTATQADTGAVTFDSVSNGTAGFTFSDPITMTGANTISVGEATTGVVVAGGTTMVSAYGYQKTAALTGDLIGIYGNARVGIDSATGATIGGYFKSGNGGGDDIGYELGTIRGVYAEAITKAPADTTATITNARGVEVNMDLDQGTSGHTVAVTTACMFYGNYNAPTSGTYATITNGYGIYVKNEAVGGTGQALDAAFYVADASMSGGIKGWDYGLDFSGVASGSFTNADIRLVNGELIDNTTNGTIGLHGSLNFAAAGGTTAASAGILGGCGTSGTPYTLPSASNKAFSFYFDSADTDTSHTLEGLYVSVKFGAGAGSAAPHGEAGRFRSVLNGDPTGVTGSHSTVEWGAEGSSCSGATYGAYNNLVFGNYSAGGGTLAGACAELFSGGSSTDLTGATASILRLSIQGTVTANLFTVPAISMVIPSGLVGNDLIFDDTAAANTVGGKLRITVNGVTYWVLCADAAD